MAMIVVRTSRDADGRVVSRKAIGGEYRNKVRATAALKRLLKGYALHGHIEEQAAWWARDSNYRLYQFSIQKRRPNVAYTLHLVTKDGQTGHHYGRFYTVEDAMGVACAAFREGAKDAWIIDDENNLCADAGDIIAFCKSEIP